MAYLTRSTMITKGMTTMMTISIIIMLMVMVMVVSRHTEIWLHYMCVSFLMVMINDNYYFLIA